MYTRTTGVTLSFDHLRAIRDSALSSTEKIVAVAVLLRSGGEDGCWASCETLGRDASLDPRTVGRTITGLLKKGVLVGVRRAGVTATLRFGSVEPRLSTTPDPRSGVDKGTPDPRSATPDPRSGDPGSTILLNAPEMPSGNTASPPKSPSRGEGDFQPAGNEKALVVADIVVGHLLSLDAQAVDREAEACVTANKLVVSHALTAWRARMPEGIKRREVAAGLRLGAEKYRKIVADMSVGMGEA